MLDLSPVKLLIVGVVAMLLLGPDRLPQVARQMGAAWRAFRQFHARMEQEVRQNLPDLPSTTELARLARSPIALLNQLADMPASDLEAPVPDAGALPATEGRDDFRVDPAAPNGNGNGNGSLGRTPVPSWPAAPSELGGVSVPDDPSMN